MEGHAGELGCPLQPVLPDGRPELILHLGDPFDRVRADGQTERQPSMLFAGQLTSQLVLRPTGRIAVVGLRFHAFGAGVLGVPQDRLAGLTVPAGDVSRPLAQILSGIRDETDSTTGALARLADRLPRALAGRDVDPRVRDAVVRIRAAHGLVSVDALAARAGMTRRHLERLFLAVVGVSPKRLARITRFQRAVAMLERPGPRDRGSRAAAACGYADQAHFIRDFQDLAGCAPGEHLVGRAELTGFFSTHNSHAPPD
jgi:AraC-like DNA-binding protein